MSRMAEKALQAKAKLEEKRRKEYVTPAWHSDRAKPALDPAVWPDPETSDNLAVYMDWHARHPNMVTPRALEDIPVVSGKVIEPASPRTKNLVMAPLGMQGNDFTEEAKESVRKSKQTWVSYGSGTRVPEELEEYAPTKLGQRGKFAQVARIAYKYETQAKVIGRFDNDDPSYNLTVKDTLETYHIDGDHTSVVLKPPKERQKSAATIAFEADAKWKMEQFGKYGGGGPSLSEKQQKILEDLTLAHGSSRDDKKIVGPWEDAYEFSKYTAEGTLLDEFNKVDLDRRVKDALTAHARVLVEDEERKLRAKRERIAAKRKAMGLDSRGSSRPSTFGSRPGTGKIHPGSAGGDRPGTGGLTAVPENEGDLEVTEVDGDGFNEFNQGDGQSVGGNTAISSIGGDDFPPEGQGQSLDGSQIGGGGGGGSLTSGSTYMHKTHGNNPIGPIDLASGASQDPRT